MARRQEVGSDGAPSICGARFSSAILDARVRARETALPSERLVAIPAAISARDYSFIPQSSLGATSEGGAR